VRPETSTAWRSRDFDTHVEQRRKDVRAGVSKSGEHVLIETRVWTTLCTHLSERHLVRWGERGGRERKRAQAAERDRAVEEPGVWRVWSI